MVWRVIGNYWTGFDPGPERYVVIAVAYDYSMFQIIELLLSSPIYTRFKQS